MRTTQSGTRSRTFAPHLLDLIGHLLAAGSPVADGLAGDDLEAVDQLLGEWPPAGLDEPGDDVGAPLAAALASVSRA